MGDVEALGLLKMDFLGLRNLDVIDKAIELVGGVDIVSIPLDDPKTYAMLQRGESSGVFQFESSGMREALRQVRPTEFEDLIALVALYRPGPMGYIPVYAKRKAGAEQPHFLDERLKPITEPTYGICIYQEQYMEIAKQLAGFSPAEADDLRKAIGKKIHALMASLKDKFLEGAAQKGVTPSVANQLWKDMEQAQDYSFNKSHAACYALIAYRTAYLKANWPAEYMAALISSVMNTKDRVPLYVAACEEMGIKVEPPDVNCSAADFAVVEGKIRFGLNAVKNVGENAVRAIVAAREADGPFESIWDFCERVDPQVVNKRALESLVKCGAFDSTGAARMGIWNVLEHAVGAGGRQQADRLAGQSSIFDLGGGGGEEAPAARRHHPPISREEWEKNERLAFEKESLGLYVSEHPLQGAKESLRRKVDCQLAEVERRRDGEIITVGGIVGAVKALTTKKGDPMVFLRLDDLSGIDRNRGLQLRLRVVARSARGGSRPRDQGSRRPQAGGGDETDRDGSRSLRSDARALRGETQGRCSKGACRAFAQPGRARAGISRRGSGGRCDRDIGGAAYIRVRARLQGPARGRLLRRGKIATRRGGRHLEVLCNVPPAG